MKTLLILILFVANLTLTCVAQNNFDPINIGPQVWGSPPPVTVSNEAPIILAPTPSDDVFVNGNANITIQSASAIFMQPGFIAGSFYGNNALCLARINSTSSVPIALLYPTPPACTFQRVEIGVGIPPQYPTLQTQIDNFTNHPQNPPYPSGMINPYDPTNLSVVATFTATDPNGNYRTYTRNGFYYQDVIVTNPVSANENFQVTDDPLYPFRVRFAPPFAGNWTVTISININNGAYIYYSDPGIFQVINCGNQGFITTDQYSNNYNVRGNWHFMYDNNNYGSGNNFIPIGQDIPDPVFPGYPGGTTPLSHNINSNSDPSVIVSGTGYDMSNDDYDYGLQRTDISNLVGMGGNFIRMLMMCAGYGIEAGSPTICDYDPASSYELDKTLEQAESENLYILLTLEYQQDLGYGNLFGFAETWNSPNQNYSPGTKYWNPYYDYLVHVEGESNPDVANFFADGNLQQYFKNRIRYIDARWGYSPNIFGYELLNEADQIGVNPDITNYEYSTAPATLIPPLNSWVSTMTNYIHGLYPSHIVTVSYAAQPTYTSGNFSLTDYSPVYIDFIEQHEYTSALPENSDRESYILSKYYYPPQNYGQTVIEKPRLIGEEGMECGNVEIDGDSYTPAGCADALVRHNDEWASAFMTSGAGFYWGNEFDPTSNMTDYKKIADFFANLSNWGVDFQNTHFSAINQYYSDIISGLYGWQDFYLVDAAAKSDADPNNQSPASDISLEIGWVSNTQYNWEDDPSGCPLDCGTATSSITAPPYPPVLYDVQDFSSYNIYVWDPYADVLKGIYSETTTFSHNIDFPATLGAIPNSYPYPEPDYAYYCYKTGDHHSPYTKNDTSQVIILPNDTVYLPSDSLSFPDSKYFPSMPGSFQWDFGNGITSSKPDAKWLYTSVGEYPLTVNYADTTEKITVEQTYIVLENNIVKMAKDSTFTIVPNPTNGIFTIFTKGAFPIDEIDVEDATGRRCFTELNPKNNIFNIATYAEGVYIVHIKSNGTEVTKKLVKL